MPIAYIQRTRERYAQYPPYKWSLHDDAPWTPLAKPIRDSRLALVSSGGFYTADQAPFVENDTSYRIIPRDAAPTSLRIYHHGYRDDDADRDPNCVFPLERLRELQQVGVIGEVTDAVSFLTIYSARKEVEERAPKIVAELQARQVEAALCVPV